MAGSEESWSPAGPYGILDAADPSACSKQDKAGEGKSAKSTAERHVQTTARYWRQMDWFLKGNSTKFANKVFIQNH